MEQSTGYFRYHCVYKHYNNCCVSLLISVNGEMLTADTVVAGEEVSPDVHFVTLKNVQVFSEQMLEIDEKVRTK